MNLSKTFALLVINRRSFSRNCAKYQKEECPEETIIVDKDESITLIGINRPRQRNAMTYETAEKLSNALSAFEADATSPIAVLYGVGGTFSSGYDIQELEAQCDRGSLDFLLRHEGSVGPTRRHSKKPIVCGINGFCVASGFELALMCDLRVMEETAILGFFNRRFGVPSSDGGTARLSSMVGYSRALELMASGRRVQGKEALQIGLVNRLVATGTALGQAVNLAFCIAKFPQASLLSDRNCLYTNGYSRHGFRAAIQTEIMNTSKEVVTELKEGVKRFKKVDISPSKPDLGHVKEKPIPDWEREEIALENEAKKKT
ncbi:probable enoyl-CoA hydratase isoform X2 [Stomoxys calcitrans]|uniref:probable enoyl-CoA hydratase isoform X2 n=1 Tax=Stomoxys calcitrans TaxID=35570 RepID=UPI0027E2C3BD|nr:probable enoyl-CoA hydratase isoform X2 [Stomoxys calcitrans]